MQLDETNPSNATRITREDFETLVQASAARGVAFGHLHKAAIVWPNSTPLAIDPSAARGVLHGLGAVFHTADSRRGVVVRHDLCATTAGEAHEFELLLAERVDGNPNTWQLVSELTWGDAWELLNLPEDGSAVTP